MKDAFPLPQVADLVDTLAGHKYFSTLDMASGYWQVPVDKSSQEKTAFVIPRGGHFEFLRMPFGLTNAVPTFQRLMQAVLMQAEEYDYTIEHLPGIMMKHADALSRALVNSILVSTLPWREIEELQSLDEDIQLVRTWVQDRSRPDRKPDDASEVVNTLYNCFNSLVIKNNVLCRKWIDKTENEREQVVVPLYAVSNVLEEAHRQVGHAGVAKTFDMIQRKFYWPGFFKSVEEFCRSCEVCKKNKTVPRPRSPMKPIEVVPIPFYMIGADLVGPLKTTSQGNKYILSVIDYYTKYAEAIALPNQEAVTVAKALEDVFARHGMPSVLLTDQGKNFESKVVASLCEMFGIEKRRTTAYHPQTDGLCERFNGILKSLLRTRVNREKNDWDKQLPHALLACRVTVQASTNVPPFEMLYGREARLPFGADQEMLISGPTHGPAKYVEELKKRQNDLRKLVTKRIEKAQQNQKRYYDSRYRAQLNKCFNVGNTVLLKDFRARGLDEKYTGPYLIVIVRENDCEIESMDNRNKKRKIVHADKTLDRDFSGQAYVAVYKNTLNNALHVHNEKLPMITTKPLTKQLK